MNETARILDTLPHLEERYRPGAALEACRSALAAGDLARVHQAGQELSELGRVLMSLTQSYAPVPVPVNPLAELARVENSRPEALALLDALRVAHQLAEALDAKRGDVLDEPVGGSAGLVWGDRLLQAVCGLELELFGPGETVTGARE
jgi:hypothetical protein